MIALAALAVSAASYLMFPRSYIWFGVLHAIAVSLVIAQLVVRRPALAVVAGIAVIVAGVTFESAAFDNRALGWLGFMTTKPLTEDYVPLFPWTGVLLVGDRCRPCTAALTLRRARAAGPRAFRLANFSAGTA